ncbi:hypothetical protein [Micromonospora sp. NBC_00617]|uniref:hypothetical protein n=1 Tax=Micromonospora sp. NBC_00617 TaxID=2903587 RepID=UPI0030DDED66
MNQEKGLSRRQILRVGAVVGSTVAVVAVSGESASADPGTDAAQAGSRGELARVSAVAAGGAVVGTPKVANRTALRAAERVPFAGFPDGITPRPGDLVTVTDLWPDLAVAAVPVVHWVTGVPKRDGSGYAVAGQRLAASPLLDKRTARRVRVCVLDTELADAQVLAVVPA